MNTIAEIAEKLQRNQVVAYPTEAVFGLGCNPHNEAALQALLRLKQRPIEKGLIVIAHKLELLLPFIDQSRLNEEAWQHFHQPTDKAITWVMPACVGVPRFLTGRFDSIAVRLCNVEAVAALCEASGFALTSTSANLSGLPPCRTATEVKRQFGAAFPVLDLPTGGRTNPSEIRDIFTRQIFRQG